MRSFVSACCARRRRLRSGLVALALLVGLAAPAHAQITIPNSFTTQTVADPAAVNANFTTLGNQSLNRTGGTMTGTLTSQGLTPSADATYSIGPDGTHRYLNGNFSGTVTAGALTATGTATAATFSGSGASLTALVPTTLTGTGRIPMAADYWPAYVSKAAVYTANATTDDDIDCDATAGGWSLTLPTPVGITGKTFNVKKIDASANACTVATAAGNIDGLGTFVISVQNQNMTFRSNGTNWEIR